MTYELAQRTYEDDIPTIINANEYHMALLFLLDTSGSMQGVPIDELNRGINKFHENVCKDDTTKNVLDVAIVEFNSCEHVVQDFVPVTYMEPVKLGANGGTYMSPAIRTAIDMVNTRSKFYLTTGIIPYKPWVILISDGAPLDDITAVVDEIQDMEENGKLKFFSLGVGNYDSNTLHRLSGQKVMKLEGYDFTEFFDWVNKSMRSVSESAPGQVPRGIPLPASVDKDTNDWMA